MNTGTADRIAFVQSCWHREIVDKCRDSFLDTITQAGVVREVTARLQELGELVGAPGAVAIA